MLSTKRVVIEQAFGQLVGRFRRLKHLCIRKREFVPIVIMVACILHNLCIRSGDNSPDIEPVVLMRAAQNFNVGMLAGNNKRDAIARMLHEEH